MAILLTPTLSDVHYVGADIVRGLVHRNRERFSHLQFLLMDMVSQAPYKAFDLIICRDALVHLPDEQVHMALHNFNKSGSKYLLTTTFYSHRTNRKIDDAGKWRQLNLFLPPFRLGRPLSVFNERFWEHVDRTKPIFNDKALVLWRLPVLPRPTRTPPHA